MADQNEAASEQQSKADRAEAVKKAMSSDPPSPPQNDPNPPKEAPGASSVGESTTRRAEDIARDKKEPGRHDTGTEGQANRPTGTSTARDVTGVDPQDPDDS